MRSSGPFGRRIGLVLGVAVVLVAMWAAFRALRPASHPTRILAEALSARARGEPARALQLAQQVLELLPESQPALSLAGRSAVELQEADLALSYFARMKPEASDDWLEACIVAGDVELQRGRAADAERWCRAALDQDPRSIAAIQKLAYVLG
ncbi:MAG TPA: tetratricopeptide repeat protein, partial [Planctomycetaceae bacterium]|nr:tetratricopeptide repeat protein [Planctomycetaceae bacterium]